MFRIGIGLGLLCMCFTPVFAQVYISEILVNPPGANRGGEVLEFHAPPGFSFAGYRFAQIDGDGTDRGVVRMLIDLSPFTAGANGLLVVRLNPSAAPLNPTPDPASAVASVTTPAGVDLNNGAATYVLGRGAFPVALGGDLDTNNDGILDVPLGGFLPVDAVSYLDGQSPALPQAEYAAQLGGVQLGVTIGANGLPFVPDALTRVLECNEDVPTTRIAGGWAGGDVTGPPGAGPYTWATVRTFGFEEAGIPNPHLRTLTFGLPSERYCPGACCLGDGICVQQTAPACADLKGEYLGDGTLCPPNPTPPTRIETLPEPESEFDDEFCVRELIRAGKRSGPAVTLVAVSGSGDFLRWYVDGCGAGEPLGTGSPLTLPLPEVTTTYFARWETVCGAASACQSVTVVIRAGPPIVRIDGGPRDGLKIATLTACPGNELLLATKVEDATTLTWEFTPLDETQSITLPQADSSLALGPLTPADFGSYRLVARNECGADEVVFELLPGEPPAIKVEPAPLTLRCAGEDFIVSVIAISSDLDGATYEWRRVGEPAVIATGSTLVLQNVQPDDSGGYSCTITDGCGSVESAAAELIVDDQAPEIAPLETRFFCTKGPETLLVTADVTAGRSLTWRDPAGEVVGDTATLFVPAGEIVDGDYTLTAVNGCGEAVAVLTVVLDEVAPTINPRPAINRCADDEADLVIAPELQAARTFEWFSPSGEVIGTEPILTVPASAVIPGDYQLLVTNGCGFDTGFFTVNLDEEPPTIAPLPDINRCNDDTSPLVIAPTIERGRVFEWRAPGGDMISGEPVLTIPSLGLPSGEYVLTVSNGCGQFSRGFQVNIDGQPPTVALPAAIFRCADDPADLVISPTITDGRTFEWRMPEGELAGTDATLTLPAKAVTPGDYTLTVTNGCAPKGVSATVSVFIDDAPPAITAVSSSPVEVLEGLDATFTVTAGRGRRFTLLRGKTVLETIDDSGPTVAFTRSAVQVADAGLYTLRVSNGCEPAAEETVELVVIPSRVDCVLGTDDVGNSDGRRGPAPDFSPVNFDDIDCFVAALISPESWDACGTSFTTQSYVCANDLNCDGVVNFDDIGRFVDCVVAGRCSSGAPPAITTQPPALVQAELGGTAVLQFTPGSASPPYLLRWQRFGLATSEFVDLPVDNPTVQQSALVLTDLSPGDAGEYRVALRDGCGEPLFSDPVVLVIECVTCLPGDTNGDGVVSFDDIECFVGGVLSFENWKACGPIRNPELSALTQYYCGTDVNRDGFVNFDDIEAFTFAVLLGPCPQERPR